jgi:hypothetical protein
MVKATESKTMNNQEEQDCVGEHQKLVTFDPVQARDMSSTEIRKRFPRITCQECGTVVYASYEHYIAGDW